MHAIARGFGDLHSSSDGRCDNDLGDESDSRCDNDLGDESDSRCDNDLGDESDSDDSDSTGLTGQTTGGIGWSRDVSAVPHRLLLDERMVLHLQRIVSRGHAT